MNMVSPKTALRMLKHDRDAGSRALLAAAQIETADQILYLKAHLVDKIPYRQLADLFGWSAARVERTRKQVDSRLTRFRAGAEVGRPQSAEEKFDSSVLVYRERLESGRLIWSLRCPGRVFLEVMRAERMPKVHAPVLAFPERRPATADAASRAA
jgi:hypothetical protein